MVVGHLHIALCIFSHYEIKHNVHIAATLNLFKTVTSVGSLLETHR